MCENHAHLDQAKQLAWPLIKALDAKIKYIMWPWIISITLIVVAIYAIKRYFDSAPEPTPDYVSELLEKAINGTAHPFEWDGFLTCPYKNSEIESIRLQCQEIYENNKAKEEDMWVNEKGAQLLKGIQQQLHEKASNK